MKLDSDRKHITCDDLPNPLPKNIPLGDVGYHFCKKFPDHGYFYGYVVQIRPNAELGKDRRCVYSDGDLEDLSLSDLHALARVERKSGKKPKSANRNILKEITEYLNIANKAFFAETKTPVSIVDKYNSFNSESTDSISRSLGHATKNRVRKRKPTSYCDDIKNNTFNRRVSPRNRHELKFQFVDEMVNPKSDSKDFQTIHESVSVNRDDTFYELCNSDISEAESQREIYNSNNASKRTQITKYIETSNDIKVTDNPQLVEIFSSASELLPVDIAAESTMEAHTDLALKMVEDEEDENEDWLEKVASMLGAANSTTSSRLKMRRTEVVTKEVTDSRTNNQRIMTPIERSSSIQSNITKNSDLPGDTILPSDPNSGKISHFNANGKGTIETSKNALTQTKGDHLKECDDAISRTSSTESIRTSCFSSLIDIPSGKRHGLKVLYIHDERRIVGEVLMEHQQGWVEAIINGEVKKRRVRHLVVAPDVYDIGDEVDSKIDLGEKNLNMKSGTLSHNVSKVSSDEDRSLSSPSTSARKSPTSSVVENKIFIENLFYWRCACEGINNYTENNCTICDCKRSESCSPSALLDMAEHAVGTSNVYEEVLESIPLIHRSSLPKTVLKNLMPNTQTLKISLPPCSVDSYFYWNCYSCTMANSYRRVTCEACHMKNDAKTTSSVLLSIAKEAALKAYSVKDALSAVPPIHKPAIPEAVLKSLVTCNATTAKDKRCLRPKAPGSNFCRMHTDPTVIDENEGASSKLDCIDGLLSESSSGVKLYTNGDSVAITESQEVSNALTQDIYSLKSSFSGLLGSKLAPHHVNNFQWNIHCIEDAILSQEHTPFALGMRVRRFFPRYGFHDGTITSIQRQNVEESNSESRPMLLYRVSYNDGDSEDVFHHQINSLRQIYDQCNVEPTAPASEQLLVGTLYETFAGNVEIIPQSHKCTSDDKIFLHVFRTDEPCSSVELDLTLLQLIVIRKLRSGCSGNSSLELKRRGLQESIPEVLDTSSEGKICPAPVLEWPSIGRPILINVESDTKPDSNRDESTEEEDIPVVSGLSITRKPFSEDPYSDSDDEVEDDCCIRPGVKCSGWDPAGGLHSVLWDPFKVLICEVCKSGKDETRILICDKCNGGYHTFCVRPVIVNIPSYQWLCPKCTGGSAKKASFKETVNELVHEPTKISSFLSFPFSDPSNFCIFHKETLDIISPNTVKSKKLAVLGPLSDSKPTRKLGALHVSRTKYRHFWILPVPLSDPGTFRHSLATMVAAMKDCGMEKYNEELVYEAKNGVTESMNNVDLDLEEVGSLNKLNLGIFARYKENLKSGVYPPIRIINDDKVGFTVEALAPMPRHTIVTEYVGEVTTIENSYSGSDSLMTLLDTGDPKTSLIIDPARQGNIARFLSGINNRSYLGRRKANVRSRRFSYEGRSRIVLFTSKLVEPGDILHYDYNAGNEGKSVAEWAETGFYDTSNFV